MSNLSCEDPIENKLNVNNVRLRDLIDINILQCFQDHFSKALGLASITVDLDGTPVTQPSNYTNFCMNYTHSTECGDKRCAESHLAGGKQAVSLGKPFVYECHAGLIDFAAPIMLEGRQIGTILGGQVLTEKPEESKYRKIAREIKVNENQYIEALRKIPLLSNERIESAANMLYIVANYMSQTAYYMQLLTERSNLLTNGLSRISAELVKSASISLLDQADPKMTAVSVNTITSQFNKVIALIKNVEEAIILQQKEIARLDRLNLIGEMAASIGHEIRNPLTTVRGFLQLFSRKAHFSDHIADFDTMIEELDRANGIITEFLSLAKNRKIDLKTMDLNQIIERLIPLLQADAMLQNIQIKSILGKISPLLLDEKEIRQLVLNLVRNAIEASKKYQVVKIATFDHDQKTVLQITDEGCGMSEAILEKIGTPFLSTKSNGTGLGLAVCYRIADHHSASIVFNSHEGIGTQAKVIFN